ncbi:Zinc finger protein 518B [Sciurus carolinensis]|uniref:Zinc finger protein 518B n=1 Tax=Sciurus carolinensis TaxID=30640 RepID=A0AA41SUM3_SCICA|nr:Zinc finger protein 518B [Sciurus carolinensis]
MKSSVLCGPGAASGLFPCKAASSFAENGRNVHRDSQQLFHLAVSPTATSCSGEKGLLPAVNHSDLEPGSQSEVPAKMSSSTGKLKDDQAEDKAASSPGQTSSPQESPPQQPLNEDGNGELPHQQIYRQFANGSDGNTKSRGTRKAHVAIPVLNPKGAVLRVLNSSEDAHIVEATCDAPAGIPCSKAQLSKPAPSCPMKQTQTCSL